MSLYSRKSGRTLYITFSLLIFLFSNLVFGQWFPDPPDNTTPNLSPDGQWLYPMSGVSMSPISWQFPPSEAANLNRNFPYQPPHSNPYSIQHSSRLNQLPTQTDPSEGWTLMSGITDLFLEVKALSGTDTLIVSTQESGMYWTDDFGVNWHVLSTPTSNVNVASQEIFHNQGQTEILIVFSGNIPYLRRSTDMGQNWAPASEQLPNLQYHRLFLDQYHRLWAFYDNEIYFSDDYGVNWDSMTVAPEVTRIWNVWVSPQDSSKLWVAADRAGAYFSPNRGQSWNHSYIGGDVHDIEGNPQNPYSAIAIMFENEMHWNHGDGIWEYLYFPVLGTMGDIVFLHSDSTQLLGIQGYNNYNVDNNIFFSQNGGQSWTPNSGPLISAIGRRIQPLNSDAFQIAVLLSGGALLCDSNWNNFSRLNVGVKCLSINFLLSMHQIGSIWAYAMGGIYVSSDGGFNWTPTPFASRVTAWAEHTGRLALYLQTDGEWLFRLSYPSLSVDTLSSPPGMGDVIFTSEADSSLLYSLSSTANLWVSHDGGQSWQLANCPAEPGEYCIIHPSSTLPNFAMMANCAYGLYPNPRVWRTFNFGQSWELVYEWNHTSSAWGYDSWSGLDVLTDFNYYVEATSSEEWYFYSLNGGDSFDSVLTSLYNQGYSVAPWGDSVRVWYYGNEDSISITPDRGQTIEFRLHYPAGVPTHIYSGHFSQLISKDYYSGVLYYHGPYTNCSPQHPGTSKSNDISISIYPNPTNSIAFLDLSVIITTNLIHISIYDILGRRIRSLQIGPQLGESPRLALPINNLPSGTYFVVVHTSEPNPNLVKKITIIK